MDTLFNRQFMIFDMEIELTFLERTYVKPRNVEKSQTKASIIKVPNSRLLNINVQYYMSIDC